MEYVVSNVTGARDVLIPTQIKLRPVSIEQDVESIVISTHSEKLEHDLQIGRHCLISITPKNANVIN